MYTLNIVNKLFNNTAESSYSNEQRKGITALLHKISSPFSCFLLNIGVFSSQEGLKQTRVVHILRGMIDHLILLSSQPNMKSPEKDQRY